MLSIPESSGAEGGARRGRITLWFLAALSLGISGCASGGDAGSGGMDGGDASVEGGGSFVGAAQDSSVVEDGSATTDALTDAPAAPAEGASVDGEGGACAPHTGSPVIDPTTLPACSCSGAHCVPNSLVPAASAGMLADCDPANKCVPDALIASGGNFILPTCTSVGGAEGRCLSQCVPAVKAQASQLPQSTCAAGDLCAPCFDPFTGKNTGACNQSCDPGPQQPPVTFPTCCNGKGTCVPSSTVPDAQKSQLGPGSCPVDSNHDLCAPTELASAAGGFLPPTCRSLDNAEGRCLSTCLPAIAAQASTLPQSTCAPDHLCAPCYDPITGADTNACRIGADTGPKEPAVTFPKCCNATGTCVPSSTVPAAQTGQLGAESCPVDANQFLCAPNEFTAAGGFTPPSCRSLGGGEGRCLSVCLPAIAAQASTLPQSTCMAGHVCAPCYDPLTGADTNACRVSNDPGPKEPPFTFPKCCSGNGTCVPSSTVPASQQSQLGGDSCPVDASGYLCAPNEFTASGGFTPPTCRSIANAEGRCLSTCLPSIAAQASQLPQSTCAAGHLCAPCYDPLTGADTKACRISNDPGPQEPPFTFPSCCTSRGVCVPMSLVPASRQSQLGQDTCPNGQNYLCVAPRAFATTPTYKPPTCTGAILLLANYTGVCLPDCLAAFSGLNGLLIPQGSCASSTDKCAPCVNPLTNQSTGACN